MLSWHAFLIYCGAYAVVIAVPGPGIVAIVARALNGGFKSTIPAVLGTAVGDLVLMSLSVFGLALVARALGGLFLVVKLAGAAYLFYIAFKFWTARVSEAAPAAPSSARDGFVSQLFLTLGNPKAIAFFVALLPAVVDLHSLKLTGYLQLVGATFLLIPSITLIYAACAARVRGVMASAKARKRINRTAAVVMVGAGVGVAMS
jgi:threonine/homoserine/homoserine lactone efflux protein